MQVFGKALILFGILAVLLGMLLQFSDRIPFLGKLPGDITLKRDNFQIYIPITTSVLISLVLSVVFWLVTRFRGK
jgi:hypothetical protein